MKTTGTKWALGVLAVTAVALACDEWSVWDDMFKRSAVGPNNRGWTGGDGVFSAALPNNREFWIFGDTYMTPYTADGNRGPNPLSQAIVGNTIAVQGDRSNPSASNIEFYARDAVDFCIHTGVTNITSVSGTGTDRYRQFFNHFMLGLEAAPVCRNLWPAGAECIDCDDPVKARLLLSFYEWEHCDPATESNCTILGTRYTGNIIARIKNIDQPPSSWERDGTALYMPRTSNNELVWGAAFLKDLDGNIYIYGYQPGTDRLFVARSTMAGVLSGGWETWRTSGFTGVWSTNRFLPMRVVAEQAAPGTLSIDRVTRNGVRSYVLVQSRPGLNHHLYVRTTSPSSVNGPTSAATWNLTGPTTPRIDLATIDSSLGWSILDLINRGKCQQVFTGTSLASEWRATCTTTPCPNPLPSCGLSYHGMAHFELASADASGTSGIPASYIIPAGPNPFFNPSQPEDPFVNARQGGFSAAYYRPKFTAIAVSTLKPWCTSGCWEGIVKAWPRRQIGSNQTFYYFDLQNATKIWAELSRIAGNASMRIDFYNGFSFISSTTCPASGSTVTCNNVTKPWGTSWAAIAVTGVATDEFSLTVHHAGNY